MQFVCAVIPSSTPLSTDSFVPQAILNMQVLHTHRHTAAKVLSETNLFSAVPNSIMLMALHVAVSFMYSMGMCLCVNACVQIYFGWLFVFNSHAHVWKCRYHLLPVLSDLVYTTGGVFHKWILFVHRSGGLKMFEGQGKT